MNRKTISKIKKNKIKLKCKFLILFFTILILLFIILGFYIIKRVDIKKNEKLEIIEKQKQEKLLNEIKSAYNKYVKTIDETIVFELKDNEYIEAGIIGKNVELTLSEINITYGTLYFLIENLNLYISYKDVVKIENLTINDSTYKKYVPFNENIVTKTSTSFYNDDGLVYKINKGMTLPIIIKDTDKYYVEFNDLLLYVKKDEVDIKTSKNTTQEIRKNIRTLTYHTIYDKEKEKCTNTVICHPIEQFESHMKYLSENDYFTLRMKDLELFLDGKIQIPKKSIVITLDDGKYAINAVNIVEKYKVYATYFIITKRYNVSNIKTTYMDFESHTHNLHNNWKCSGGNQGGELLCASENKILQDLKTSQEKLGGATSFAYPFFDFNERAINLLKKSGFTLAFIGQYDTDGYSYKTTDKMKLRRKTIFSTDSIQKFISHLK